MIANILSTELVKCSRCNQYKPQADYYKRSGLSVFYTWCKQCHKTRVAPQVALFDRLDMRTNNIERDVIVKLSNMGIFSVPSKRVAGVRTDIVAWGCVNIEVKSSVFHDGKYKFAFTPKQVANGLKADILILVCIGLQRTDYHIFDTKSSFLYTGGRLKYAIEYSPDRIVNTNRGKQFNPLSRAEMDSAHNNWDLIEIKRLEISNRIKSKTE